MGEREHAADSLNSTNNHTSKDLNATKDVLPDILLLGAVTIPTKSWRLEAWQPCG